MLNLNLNSMLCNNRPPFTPPNPSEAQQWLPGAEEDKPLFSPFKYMPDNLGVDSAPVVVDVAQADRAVGYFKNDFVDCGLTYEPQGQPLFGYIYSIPESLQDTTILSKEYVFKIGLTSLGNFRVLVGNGLGWTSNATAIAPYTVGTFYCIEYCFDFSASGNYSNVKINGVTVWDSTIAYSFISSDRNLVIGNYQNSNGSITSEKFDGVIYDVSISNGVDSSLWKLDEEIGNIAYDSIGTMNGTISEGLPVSFHDKGIATTKGAYGLHDLTQTVVPVAIADTVGFNNDGNDFARSNTPYELGSLIDGFKTSYRIVAEFHHKYSSENSVIYHVGTTSGDNRVAQIVVENVSNKIAVWVSGIYIRHSSLLSDNSFNHVEVIWNKNLGVVTITVNGVSESTVVTPSSNNNGDYWLTIGAFFSAFPLGLALITKLQFYTLEGVIIDDISAGFADGGATFTSSAGILFNVTDGLPQNAWDYGIATKYNINAHGLVTTTDFAGDEWLTRAEIDALHNDTTIFTSDDGLSVLRSLPYDDINTLDAGQISKINRYMGR